MTDRRKPSIARIIQSDFVVLLGILLPAVSLVMYIAIAYFGYFPGFRGHDPIQGTEGAPLFFYLFIGGLVLGAPLAYLRIRAIRKLFNTGVEVAARITALSFYKDRGRVEYTYNFQGQSHAGGTAIMKNSRTQLMRPGMDVVLLVDPAEPKRALIRDLYI